jgi:putative ABC transport system substrate-binding protein
VSSDLAAKQLELLKEAVPGLSRVVALWNPADPGAGVALGESQDAARRLGLTLQVWEVRGSQDFLGLDARLSRERPGALLAVQDPLIAGYREVIVELAAKHRLPAMYGLREFVDAGGLMSYGANVPDLFRRAAVYVDRILKGVRPSDLPVEQPTRFELRINLKTARDIRLTIPQSLLIRADDVIR